MLTTQHPLGKAIQSQYKKEETVFESNTAGTSTLEVKQKGLYYIECVGGGGGSAATAAGSGGHNASCSGASGAGFIGTFMLNKGIYTITIGQGGAKGPAVRDSHSTASPGTASSISNVITCNAGGGGEAWWRYSWRIPSGGTVVTHITPTSTILNKTGSNGTGGNGTGVYSCAGPISGKEYGRGGNAQSNGGGYSYTENGVAGYVKITYKGTK